MRGEFSKEVCFIGTALQEKINVPLLTPFAAYRERRTFPWHGQAKSMVNDPHFCYARYFLNELYAAGMTLLELMIALAIAAVLMAFAVPAYHQYIARGQRTAAVTAIYRAVQYVERSRDAFKSDPTKPKTLELPADLARSPDHGRITYRLRVIQDNPDSGGYAIEAWPVEGGLMEGDTDCGIFVIDALGRRSNRHANDPKQAAARCWG